MHHTSIRAAGADGDALLGALECCDGAAFPLWETRHKQLCTLPACL